VSEIRDHGPDRSAAIVSEAHAATVADVLATLGTSSAGLSEAEAERRLRRFGPNTIAARPRASALRIALHQFQSPVIYLLLAAGALALYFGETEEAIAIGAVLCLNALIATVTELRAARSVEALRALGTHAARVRRGGETRVVDAERLTPGDIVLVEAGDAVAADLRLIEAHRLGADESTLTGESALVEKATAPVATDARLADRPSMLFKGTTVIRGSGVGVVVAVGLDTEVGRITRLVEEAAPETSPLERRLARLSGQLIWITLALAAVIAAVGIASGKDALLMVEAAIALAVAAIPEGLPIVATLALARGMLRLARHNALVDRLSAVETLGATTVILTDKTGTLTENRMAVRRIWPPAEAPGGGDLSGDGGRQKLVEVAVLCNGAALDPDPGSGDPMELALLRLGRSEGIEREALLERYPLAAVHAFETETRMMATVHRLPDGCFLYAVKGAPEAVLARCGAIEKQPGAGPAGDDWRQCVQGEIERLGHEGLRLLACASKIAPRADANPFEDLTFLGLIGLEDPPRADVPPAVAACRSAGIKVVMVTGDHAVTARAIARRVGLGDGVAGVIEGRNLARLIARDPDAVLNADVFARVNPAEKLALVKAYQGRGEIVAMTGDGVNDAPALRQADIGVAMGLRGTDVARQAADMILLDDAFPTIVRAVHEGRVIFGNIQRFIVYLLSCNLSEVLVVGLATLSTLPLPILPLQILYLNLVTDVFPAFALAMGNGDGGVMRQGPRNPRQPIVGRAQWWTIAGESMALAAGTIGAMLWAMALHFPAAAVTTTTFLTLAFGQLWHVFNMRGRRAHPLYNEVTRNRWVWRSLIVCTVLLVVPCYWPPLARVLGLVQPGAAQWAIVAAMSLAPLVLLQLIGIIASGRVVAGRARSGRPQSPDEP
jgi:Ca2+-transporting ATPase